MENFQKSFFFFLLLLCQFRAIDSHTRFCNAGSSWLSSVPRGVYGISLAVGLLFIQDSRSQFEVRRVKHRGAAVLASPYVCGPGVDFPRGIPVGPPVDLSALATASLRPSSLPILLLS